MPSSSRVRPHHLSRKELKQPDDFMIAAGWARDFAEKHLPKVIVGLVAILLVTAAAFAYHHHRVTVEEQASQEFYDAFQSYNAGNYKTAQQRFLAVSTDYAGSEPAHLATFYSGMAYIAQKNWSQAIDMLSTYISQGGSFLRQLATYNLGVAYEASGDLSQAQENFAAAAGMSGPATIDAKLANARVFESEGKRRDAITAYQQLLTDPQAYSEREQVMAALARLNVTPAAAPAGSSLPARNPVANSQKPAVQANTAATPAARPAPH